MQTTLRAAALASLLAAVQAQALTLEFSGSGVVQGPAPVLPLFADLSIGPADASYTLGGVPGWSIDVDFSGSVTVVEDQGMIVIVGGWTGGMAGQFLRGADSLFFTGSQYSPTLGTPITLQYTITGGTGAFAGYTGTGTSQVLLLGDPFGLPTPVPFMETAGLLTLQPIPEPASWALWMSGLAGVAALVRRRRVG